MNGTPVVFLIFNRPESTRAVFERIRKARPQKLLVVADGPRKDRPDDARRCTAARAVVDEVDWPCQILRNFSDTNLGLRDRVAGGLDWAFSQVERAIVLEDDCLPDPTFFGFCEEMLEQYKDDDHVLHISGSNPSPSERPATSFIFSRWVFVWGWASWRRAWRHFDLQMKKWPEYQAHDDLGYFGPEQPRVRKILDQAYEGKSNSWATPWAFAVMSTGGLSIVPTLNLIHNIGFGEDATNTSEAAGMYLSIPSRPMTFPIKAPKVMTPDRKFDRRALRFINAGPTGSLLHRIKHQLYMFAWQKRMIKGR